MKYILEQGCNLDLTNKSNYYAEICDNFDSYFKQLEELIYIGERAFELSEYIARSQICPRSITFKIEESTLTILIQQPYSTIFDFVMEDLENHSSAVVLSDSIHEFKTILKSELGMDYDYLCNFIFHQLSSKQYSFATINLDLIINNLLQSHGYSEENLRIFYSGLTVSKRTVMSFSDSILKTQSQLRYMYRPIVEYQINGKTNWLIGGNKWSESLASLTTNCFPFGEFPEEWKQLKPLATFIQKINDTHDKILEEPAGEILQNAGIKFDRNVKTIQTDNNRGVSLLGKDIGEIDLLFINEADKVIFVVE